MVPELLIPLAPTGVSPENVRFLRHLLLDGFGPSAPTARRERLYISRARATSRRLSNEDELRPILNAFGFRVCYFEDFSLAQQIASFQRAEIVLASHGAAWTNLIFAPLDCLALEIVPAGMELTHPEAYHLYARLAAAAGLAYTRVLAQTDRPDYPHAGNLRLDPAKLVAALRAVDI